MEQANGARAMTRAREVVCGLIDYQSVHPVAGRTNNPSNLAYLPGGRSAAILATAEEMSARIVIGMISAEGQ